MKSLLEPLFFFYRTGQLYYYIPKDAVDRVLSLWPHEARRPQLFITHDTNVPVAIA